MSQTFVLDGDVRRSNLIQFLMRLPFVLNQRTKAWKVVISEYRPQRSDEQNGALFGVAYPPLMEHMGLRGDKEKEELHELMCGMYFGWVTYTMLGQTKKRPRRTTTTDEFGSRDVLNKLDFASFYDFVQQKGAENGVFIPDPDPMWRRNLAEAQVVAA